MLTLVFESGLSPASARAGREVYVWRDQNGEPVARALVNVDGHWVDWPAVGRFRFSLRDPVVRVWPSQGVPRDQVVTTFEHALQPLILQASGWQALHAGAALAPGGAVALIGLKGAGKSTLTYALAASGWKQLADDALVVRVAHTGVTVCPIAFTPRLRETARQYFGSGRSLPTTAGAADTVSEASLRLQALFTLHRTESAPIPPRADRLSPVEAFRELLKHAHCLETADEEASRRLAEDYLTMAESVPVFRLRYAPGFERLSEVVLVVMNATAALSERAGKLNATLAEV